MQETTEIKTKNLEDKFSTLDIPTNGSVPKWLEDMSNTVKRTKSGEKTSNLLEFNDSSQMATPKIAEEYFDYLLKTPVKVQVNSAKHGRRAQNYQNQASKISENEELLLNDYIVPKIQDLEISKSNFKRNSSDRKLKDFKKKIEELEEIDRYTPSLLDKENSSSQNQNRLNPKKALEISIPKNFSIPDFLMENTTSKKIFLKDENFLKKNFLSQISSEGSNFLIFDETLKTKKSNRKFSNSTPGKRAKYKKFKKRNILLNFSNKKESLKKIDDVFIIPELPTGSKMTINILTTWGDRFYVGLNGIEIFDSDGYPVEIKKIVAPDINSLPECVNDPRVAENLFDGENRTHDDRHLWLAPFDSGKNHYINIEFMKHSELAMMRIWNYNKSRIHSYRGARYVEITLDDVPIFKGEIAKACGSVNANIESYGDTILFTTQESILEKVSKNDRTFQTLVADNKFESNEKIEDRPITATENQVLRPSTFAKKPQEISKGHYIGTHKIDIVLMSNWGRNDFIGLTGIELISEPEIPITENVISCNYKGSLSSLINGENLTENRENMWSVVYNPIKHVILTIKFENYTYLSGVKIWNYNENIEKSFGGVRNLKIFLDNKLLPNPFAKDSTFILRRAPGNTNYDFVQEISFASQNSKVQTTDSIYDFTLDISKNDDIFEPLSMPEGFVIQIVIYTTWGDQYYTGLNGIELYDQIGRLILLTENNICAHPESVNVLPGISGDVRTPDKLIDGKNEDTTGTNSWLVPIVPKCLNRIYIVFDQPVTISVIKFWNYLKTPSRGVREFGILFDDLLVYNGILDRGDEKALMKYQSILFTNNSDVIKKEMATIVKHSIESQGTELTNEKARMTTGGSLPNVDQSLRPFTSVHHFRGRTSQSS